MQREEKITLESLELISEAVYKGDPEVFEVYSEFESDVRHFPTRESLQQLIAAKLVNNEKHKFIFCALRYPGSNGVVRKRRVELNPKKCNGATFRYVMAGWGLIAFQVTLTDIDNISCSFSVESRKGADTWSDINPELGSPSLWNWQIIEKNTRRLIRVLRKVAKPPQ
ncbi:MAG: hypothetical protein IPM21_03610 [Acidobacteria bacterium]|nr:hypothetical protein [Acidobacteriota bacterium]